MLDKVEVLLCVLIPGLLVWGFFFFPGRRDGIARAILGAGIGLGITFFALRCWSEYQRLGDDASVLQAISKTFGRIRSPKEAQDWLIWLFPIAGLLGSVERCCLRTRWLALVWGGGIALSLWLMLRGSVHLTRDWSLLEAVYWIGGIAMGGVLIALLSPAIQSAGHSDTSQEQRLMPIAWGARWLQVLVFGAAMVVLIMSGSQTFGMLGLAGVATVGQFALATMVKRSSRVEDGSGGVWVYMLLMLLSLGLFYAELNLVNFCLLGAALGAAGMTKISSRRLVFGVGLLLCLVFSGLAVGRTAQAFSQQMKQKASDPYRSVYGD